MVKRIIIALLLVMAIALAGCEGHESRYPRVVVETTCIEYDDKRIAVGGGYVLDDSHPYDRVYTDQGVDIVIHFSAAD